MTRATVFLTGAALFACSESTPSPPSPAGPTGPSSPAGEEAEPGGDDPRAAKDLVRPHLFRTEDGLVGVAFDIAEGWHVYWRNPGDSGLPTEIDWSADGTATLFPLPHTFNSDGDITSYGYTNSVALFARRTSDESEVHARVSWLACREACVKGGVSLKEHWAALPVEPHHADRGRIPIPLPASITPEWTGTTVSLTLPGPVVEFFPLQTEPAFVNTVETDGDRLTIAYRRGGTADPSPELGVVDVRGPEGPMAFTVDAPWPAAD